VYSIPFFLDYSDLFPTRGSAIQPISITPYRHKQTGCKTIVPRLCARSPVRKGNTAPPELPNALIKLRLTSWIFLGSSLAKTAVEHGNIGPRSKPRIPTATASHIFFGTSQVRSWKAMPPATRRATASLLLMRFAGYTRRKRPRVMPAQKLALT
jgi:hypothetical protein